MGPDGGPDGRSDRVRVGFIPLTDCAPLIVAGRLGFAENEGICLDLVREASWAALRDRMAVRHLDVAHMLAPMPIADSLGLSPLPTGLIVPLALGTGGNTITVSTALWERLRAEGAPADFDPAATARALAAAVARPGSARITFGIVHPHSAHQYQLAYWLASAGLLPHRDVDLVVVPPPLTPAALEAEQIDGFCVGEPWGSIAVLAGLGRTVTTNVHIWHGCPEKVLAVRQGFADADPDRLGRLVRAIDRAARWCDEPANREMLVTLLADETVLDHRPAALWPGLTRRIMAPDGVFRTVDGFLTFAADGATRPRATHALWFYAQMARWGQVTHDAAHLTAARGTYRPDLYDAAWAGFAAHPVIPPADDMLGPDSVFDHRSFEPQRIEAYLAAFAAPRRGIIRG
jgi:NitT/TauT family transport system ATP-binding protein